MFVRQGRKSFNGFENMIRPLSVLLLYLALSACISTQPLTVHQINALSSVNDNDGSFLGLEALADPIPGKLKNRVNIFYLHGIGWTEDPEADQLGNDFLSGVAKAYNINIEGHLISQPCGSNEHSHVQHPTNHILITPEHKATTYYETLIPGTRLALNQLACMDKQTLEVDPALEFVVYRIFWDNLFWDQLQYAHVGQDDARGSSVNFAKMRRKYNRQLKDELVNYGFSDAVMYLGPAGREIRNAIRGAMCSAALDAAGYSFDQQGHETGYQTACQTAAQTLNRANQFAFVTESLGSKITFDVMRQTLTDDKTTLLDEMIAGSETYMLANQLALLALSDLSLPPKVHAKIDQSHRRPKIIALSEVNDFLTYEINPFFEQLWALQDHPPAAPSQAFDQMARNKVIDRLGFDFIDMRVEFADPIVPFLDEFVDPLQAHGGHASEPELVLYLLCGAKNGALHLDGCLASPNHF